MDVSSTVTTIVAAGVSAGLIGVAVLTIRVGIKAFHWVRAAMS